MVRSMCWILALCTFCAILFFRSGRADASTPPQVMLPQQLPQTMLPERDSLTPLPKTYAEARRMALDTGKPMVVWVGSALCPACVASTKEEFVHWVAPTFPDTPPDALVVAVVEGSDLIRVGTMTEWPKGHLTTVRDALATWRTSRWISRPTINTREPAYRPQTLSYSSVGYGRNNPYLGKSASAFSARGRSRSGG